MEPLAARWRAVRDRVHTGMEPRDRHAAARSATVLILTAALASTGWLFVTPPGTGLIAFTVAAAVPGVLVGLVLLVRRWERSGPTVIWVLPAVLGLVMITVLNLLTDDASAAAQVFLGFPVLYASAHLRPFCASVVLVLALASDLIVNVALLPPREVLINVTFVGATLVTTTVLLVRSGQLQDAQTAELTRLAAIDPLTSLVTRRVLHDAAHTALASAAHRDGTALLVLDIDHFKSINDTLGHPVGDAALVHVATVVSGVCRSHDVLSRLGGDEIAILLPGCSARAGIERAEMVAMAVRETPMWTQDGPVAITVSVGVAHAPTDAADLRGLYGAADVALYAAKRGGRNRVGRFPAPADGGSRTVPVEECVPGPVARPGAVTRPAPRDPASG